MPHPPVQRGIRIIEEALKAAGHEVIEFGIPESAEVANLTVQRLYMASRSDLQPRIYIADGGKDILDACKLSGEPIIPNIASVVALDTPAATINEVWDLQLERTSYQKKMLEAWNETAKRTTNGKVMDAFIAPIAPFAAVAHNQYDHVSYTSWVPSHPITATYKDQPHRLSILRRPRNLCLQSHRQSRSNIQTHQ